MILNSKKLRKLRINPKLFFKDAIQKKIFWLNNKYKKYFPKKYKAFSQYTIISAVYNVEKYLEDYFNSIINQRLDFKKNIFMILVDDGSTDNSANIIKAYQKKYPRNIVYLYKENGGQASARNLGLKYMRKNNYKTPWVTFTDPDDFLDANYFYSIDLALRKYQDHKISFIASQLIFYYEKIQVFNNDNVLKFLFKKKIAKLVNNSSLECIQLSAPSTCVNYNLLISNNITFNEDIKLCSEDANFIARIIINNLSHQSLYIDNALYYYRRRSDGNSTMGNQDMILNNKDFYINTVEKAYISILNEALQINTLVPLSIQRWFLCLYILQFIHLRKPINESKILYMMSKSEIRYFFQMWEQIFHHIQDEVILFENDIILFDIFEKALTFLLFKPMTKYCQCVFVDKKNDTIQILYLSLNQCKMKIYLDHETICLSPQQELFLDKKIFKYYYEFRLSDINNKIYIKIDDRYADMLYKKKIFKILNFNKMNIMTPAIISAKPDGFGMRLSSMLVGLYLSKKLSFNFYFLWPEKTDLEQFNIRNHGVSLPSIFAIFEFDFINKYLLINSKIKENYGTEIWSKKRTLEELKNIDSNKQWGWFSTEQNPSEWIYSINRKECLLELSSIYQNIPFSDRFRELMILADEYHNKIGKEFIAIHIRSGDVVFSDTKNLVFHPMMEERYFPYEIAIELILNIGLNQNIVIFGQDQQSNKKLVEFFEKYFKDKFNIFIITKNDRCCDENEQMFFEVNLLSRAKVIYSSKESAFSRLAMYIAGKDILISYHNILNQKSQIETIEKYSSLLKLDNIQRSMSYFFIALHYYNLKNFLKSLDYAKQAADFDMENYGYVLFLIYNYLLINNLQEAEQTISYYIDDFNNLRRILFYLFHWSNLQIREKILEIEFNDTLYCLNFLKMIVLFESGDYRASELFDKMLKANKNKDFWNRFYIVYFAYPDARVKLYLSYRLGYIFIHSGYKLFNLFYLINTIKRELLCYRVRMNKIKELQSKNIILSENQEDKDVPKAKNHLSYKLGVLLIRTHKSYLKLGYFTLLFRVIKLFYKHSKKRDTK
ncbi:glycosyltransferase family 2 protein [Campylobacter coli]|uniref:glycosyltransferase family 2 protein n=1 Tax=Campylobacter coli TaxID=195 RepID=UPI00092EEBDB|nr:glycosyltransferase family A protein [Campylobacter coli]HEC1856131.1 glycosyltransferase family 2 protein [Campylobacter coli]